MKSNTKEWIQYASATTMVASGIVLTFISFFETGDVSDGVLWYMAQALTYAGGIFGVSIYFRNKLGESVSEIKHMIDRKMDSLRHNEFNNDNNEEGDYGIE